MSDQNNSPINNFTESVKACLDAYANLNQQSSINIDELAEKVCSKIEVISASDVDEIIQNSDYVMTERDVERYIKDSDFVMSDQEVENLIDSKDFLSDYEITASINQGIEDFKSNDLEGIIEEYLCNQFSVSDYSLCENDDFVALSNKVRNIDQLLSRIDSLEKVVMNLGKVDQLLSRIDSLEKMVMNLVKVAKLSRALDEALIALPINSDDDNDNSND